MFYPPVDGEKVKLEVTTHPRNVIRAVGSWYSSSMLCICFGLLHFVVVVFVVVGGGGGVAVVVVVVVVTAVFLLLWLLMLFTRSSPRR